MRHLTKEQKYVISSLRKARFTQKHIVDNKEIKAIKVQSTVKKSPKTELLCDGEWKFIKETTIDQKGNSTVVADYSRKDTSIMFSLLQTELP